VTGGWEVACGVVADDIGGLVEEGGTEGGSGEGDGVGFVKEVTAGDPD